MVIVETRKVYWSCKDDWEKIKFIGSKGDDEEQENVRKVSKGEDDNDNEDIMMMMREGERRGDDGSYLRPINFDKFAVRYLYWKHCYSNDYVGNIFNKTYGSSHINMMLVETHQASSSSSSNHHFVSII